MMSSYLTLFTKKSSIRSMFSLLKPKIITKKEQNFLLSWTYQNESKFESNPVGPNRKFYSFNNDLNIPSLLFEIKDRIIQKENIKIWTNEPMYGDYIGWISENGFIHEHKDLNVGSLSHIRYNLFLSVPKKGGEPIYNSKKINYYERMYFKCNSGNEMHSCEKVIGKKPRIVISYGFLIPSH